MSALGGDGGLWLPPSPDIRFDLDQAVKAALAEHKSRPLPVERTTQRVQAWKIGRLYTPDGHRLAIGAAVLDVEHPIEGDARCVAPRSLYSLLGIDVRECHERAVPKLDCKCGFYAWKTETLANSYIGEKMTDICCAVLMQVELSGRVLQFTHGYRAQTQRVLGLRLPGRCSALLCRETPVVAEMAQTGRDAPLRVWCERHKPADPAPYCLRPGDIAGALGCEVTWGQS